MHESQINQVGAHAVDSTLLERLGSVATPNISDSLDQIGRPGAMNGLAPLDPNSRFVGRARTVQQTKRPDYADPSVSYARHMTLVDSDLRPGDVVVIAGADGAGASTWGELLSTRSARSGAVGTVIDGFTRDKSSIVKLGYPLFCRVGNCSAGSKLRLSTEAIDVPVVCAGAHVEPGDVIVGDDSGVVVIPMAEVERVLKIAEGIRAAERALGRRLRDGGTFAEDRS